MRILIIEPNQEPYIEKIWNDLDSLRKTLGNKNLEVVELDEDALLVYDVSALANNVPINRYLYGLAVRGTFIITGNNKRELDFDSLTEEQIEEYTEMLTLEREEEQER